MGNEKRLIDANAKMIDKHFNKRLIDANPIVQFIMDGLNNPDKLKALGHDAIEVLAEIEFAPTVDAVEVVRCKDCKYEKTCSILWESKEPKENGYCSLGERKDNGE